MRHISRIVAALTQTISDLIAIEEMSLSSVDAIRKRDTYLSARLKILIKELERKCWLLDTGMVATQDSIERNEEQNED